LAAAECALRQPDSADVCKRAMEHYSIIEPPTVDQSTGKQSSPPPGLELELAAAELESELAHSGANRALNPSVSAGIASANALAAAGLAGEAIRYAGPRFPGEDGGHSLAEMAERDLDAALQLLAERAQYITGASGAAIALRRDQRNDMLCRASAGAKAPELGALLSTESGLSGESVRTRLPLRCDDAVRDSRVNPETCRELGIASVMIVPVLGDDLPGQNQALGVFELFSSHVGAFDERDLSALRRLGEMVETAVRLARAARTLPVHAGEDSTESKTEITTLRLRSGQAPATGEHRGNTVLESSVLDDAVLDDEPVLEVELEDAEPEPSREVAVAAFEAPANVIPKIDSAAPVLIPQIVTAAADSAAATEQPAKRPLMWSAEVHAGPDAAKPLEADQSHVPPMLRNLRKCKACGFPVSEGRSLCVECDEKQWRGQLRMPLPGAPAKGRPVVDFRQTGSDAGSLNVGSARTAAARLSPASAAPISGASTAAAATSATGAAVAMAAAPTQVTNSPIAEPSQAPAMQEAVRVPEAPILSGGLETQESWLGANKYILGAILMIAAVLAGIAWLR
jgi:hypothetical protein